MDYKNFGNKRLDKEKVLEIVKIYANDLCKIYNVEKIYLFGSYAKGTQTESSDIDVAVILNDYDSSTDIQLQLMRMRRKIDSRIEPHPFLVTEFDPSNPIVNEIIKNGKEIKFRVN